MSNPFSNWTPEMVRAHNERVTKQKANLPIFERGLMTLDDIRKPLNVTNAAPKKKALLNKTETLWKGELERRGHEIILVQAITLRLGDRLTYRPDLATVEPIVSIGETDDAMRLTCYETKAPHRFKAAGVTKIKAAAKQYPFIRFVLVMRDKGKWTEREIGSE